MTEKRITSSLQMDNLSGAFAIRERVERRDVEADFFSSKDLALGTVDKGVDLDLCITGEEDEGPYQLELSTWHASNEDNDRVFHSSLAIYLDISNLKNLRDYLNFLVNLGELDQ